MTENKNKVDSNTRNISSEQTDRYSPGRQVHVAVHVHEGKNLWTAHATKHRTETMSTEYTQNWKYAAYNKQF